MHFPRLFLFALAVVAATTPAAAQTLTPYDVFVLQNFTLFNTEVNGTLAVGGNADLSKFAIGRFLDSTYPDYSLVVGNTLKTNEGQVYAGRSYAGGALDTLYFGTVVVKNASRANAEFYSNATSA